MPVVRGANRVPAAHASEGRLWLAASGLRPSPGAVLGDDSCQTQRVRRPEADGIGRPGRLVTSDRCRGEGTRMVAGPPGGADGQGGRGPCVKVSRGGGHIEGQILSRRTPRRPALAVFLLACPCTSVSTSGLAPCGTSTLNPSHPGAAERQASSRPPTSWAPLDRLGPSARRLREAVGRHTQTAAAPSGRRPRAPNSRGAGAEPPWRAGT